MKIKDNQKVFVISDLHVGPYNRRTLSLRGFKCDWIAHMNHVRNCINEKCDKQSILYILGDNGFKDATRDLEDFFKSLKPQLKLCFGNHDNKKQLQKLKEKGIIQDVKHDYNLEYMGNYFYLSHYPCSDWWHYFMKTPENQNRGSYHIHGHCHGTLPQKPIRRLDVSIDNIGYYPISFIEIMQRLQQYSNIDEYGKRIDL